MFANSSLITALCAFALHGAPQRKISQQKNNNTVCEKRSNRYLKAKTQLHKYQLLNNRYSKGIISD